MHSVAVIDADEKVSLGGISSSVPWWSIGKTVLAVAALRLVEMGLLPLHAKLAGEPFTLAQLLRHEAGLPDYGGFAAYQADIDVGRSPWPVGQLLTALDAARPRYEPGTGWAYSNIGYLKVRMLIEATTGAPLDTTLRQLVFAPLGLATARLALQPADLADVEMGFRCSYHPGWVYHGLITGSVVDAASLLKKLIDGTSYSLRHSHPCSKAVRCRNIEAELSPTRPMGWALCWKQIIHLPTRWGTGA